MKEIIIKELPADMGTLTAIEDVRSDRGFPPDSEFYKFVRNGNILTLSAIPEVHDDVEDRAFLRRMIRS